VGLTVLALSIAALAALLGAPAQAVSLQPLWTLTGLEDPESAAISADGQTFYVANVAGEGDAADGRGFISRVSRDGKMLQKEWVTGMDAPRGGIVAGNRLFVSDITKLVEIDIAVGTIVARYPAPGAKFLNDVAVLPDGTVVVSDSGTARIYALKNGVMTVWAEGPLLAAVNGLSPEKDRLVIITMASRLLAMDYKTHAITVLATGIGDGDGLAALGGGRYLVSAWPGQLFEVAPDGKLTTLIDSRNGGTYINDLILVGDTLILPHMKPGSLEALKIIR
jgi:sugar lactone lactonase YvrE